MKFFTYSTQDYNDFLLLLRKQWAGDEEGSFLSWAISIPSYHEKGDANTEDKTKGKMGHYFIIIMR